MLYVVGAKDISSECNWSLHLQVVKIVRKYSASALHKYVLRLPLRVMQVVKAVIDIGEMFPSPVGQVK